MASTPTSCASGSGSISDGRAAPLNPRARCSRGAPALRRPCEVTRRAALPAAGHGPRRTLSVSRRRLDRAAPAARHARQDYEGEPGEPAEGRLQFYLLRALHGVPEDSSRQLVAPPHMTPEKALGKLQALGVGEPVIGGAGQKAKRHAGRE